MMKEGAGGRKEESGDKNVTGPGKICPGNGVTDISRETVAYGQEFC